MKMSTFVLACTVLLAAALPAHALILQGDRFVTAMKDNTVSGRTAPGTAYNLYFLPGGAATYSDAAGHRESGSWRLDRVGDVCVSWHGNAALPAGCYSVRANGRSLVWGNDSTHTDEMLRGAVTNAFLPVR